MYDEIIKKVLEAIDEKKAATYPKFSGGGYKTHRIDLRNFHRIQKSASSKKIAFVDGGNAEIIASANFSLNLIRVSCVVYQYNKKISFKKSEFLAFVRAISQNGEIYYRASFFWAKNPINLNEMLFSSFDHTLMQGINRAEISSIANAVRRFAELKLAKNIADGKSADIIVLDGNLQNTLTDEGSYLDELYESCIKNNVILTAIAKTMSLFTEDGNLLSVVLQNISAFPAWFYYPIADISNPSHKADMFFVKFHDKSKHVFRFEIFNEQKIKAEETINALSSNCMDPIFIGYPYGLIEADRIARVSNQERDSLKTILLVRLRNKNIEKYLCSVNAHKILDRIMF